jgi:hypothetical protein
MIITRTITKKILENIVHQTFSNFGMISSSALLDSLKFLGFYYATNAGISINIEDLKTPKIKREFLDNANQEMKSVSEQWQRGFVSDTERFQTIIDSWNFATEALKDRIVEYYQNFDPANNLYIMAFSGARGNMSQVRQLVGMRGLMSDQEGRIIDLPIQTNFREGLSSIDYIISSYGARKGIVDTALKTADSGYLTRRLIYIAQDLVIREIDCETETGILVLVKSETNTKNILGRTLIEAKPLHDSNTLLKNTLLDENKLNFLKTKAPVKLKVRSPLTCNSNGSICQKCYGWDLAQNKMISLGEAVGIIAAQSIGEPGTQLTMRTFHTGGIFTSELVDQIRAPFSGRIIIPQEVLDKLIPYRTTHGQMVSKLQQETILTIRNWQGLEKEIFLEIGSFLYIHKSGFIKKNELISEYSNQSFLPTGRRLKPIYPSFDGEIRFESLCVRHIAREKKPTVKVNQDDGVLWVTSGKLMTLPFEAKFECQEYLKTTKSAVKIALTSPYNGLINYNDNKISILNHNKKVEIDLSYLTPFFGTKKAIGETKYEEKLSILVKNYQYIDSFTTIGFIHLFPQKNYGKIYSIRRKNYSDYQILLLTTEEDIWKVHSDQVNDFSYFPQKKASVRAGTILNNTSTLSQSGYFLKKDGFQMVFQNALPVFVSRGTILNYGNGDFVGRKSVLATLVNYTQQTEDIVQGLPKVEELIEARSPKDNLAILSEMPGVFLKEKEIRHSLVDLTTEKNSLTKFVYRPAISEYQHSPLMRKRYQYIRIIQNNIMEAPAVTKNLCRYLGRLCEVEILPRDLSLYSTSKIGKDYSFKYQTSSFSPLFGFRSFPNVTSSNNIEKPPLESIKTNNIKATPARKFAKKWKKLDNEVNQLEEANYLFKKNPNTNEFVKWKERDSGETSTYVNSNGDFVFKHQGQQLYLRSLNPIKEYRAKLNKKSLAKPGHFIDIGEPLTEGSINPSELLSIFFKYHTTKEGIRKGTLKSVNKFQLLVVNSIQGIYQSQGVTISSKHIEIVVRQMTSHVKIITPARTPFIPGEIVRLSLILEISKVMEKNAIIDDEPKYTPLFRSTTSTSINKDGFLSAAGFQQTKKVLAKAAVEGTTDWLRGLKECVIIGRLIPAGSAFLNYKNSLDHVYFYTNESDKHPRF